MFGNIRKIIATLLIGCLLGLTFGIFLGIFLGGLPALFFREIIYSNQAVLMSITLGLILGGLLGLFAIQLINYMFDASDKPLIGVLFGMALGLIVVFFVEGVIDISGSETFNKRMHMYPIIYSGSVGGYIGSMVFPIIGATRVIRDILAKTKKARSNNKR
jgi:hypothetical protein